MTEDEKSRYKKAKERVNAIRGFYTHLFTYIIVNLALFIINYLSRGVHGGWWFYWPMIGWGIGLASHAFSVFGAYGIWGQKWEEKKIKEYMEKDEAEKESADEPKNP